MAAVVVSKAKNRGREKINSTMEKIKVTVLSAPKFSFLIKRRTKAPTSGKKINRDKIGTPKIDMNPTPFSSFDDGFRRRGPARYSTLPERHLPAPWPKHSSGQIPFASFG